MATHLWRSIDRELSKHEMTSPYDNEDPRTEEETLRDEELLESRIEDQLVEETNEEMS